MIFHQQPPAMLVIFNNFSIAVRLLQPGHQGCRGYFRLLMDCRLNGQVQKGNPVKMSAKGSSSLFDNREIFRIHVQDLG